MFLNGSNVCFECDKGRFTNSTGNSFCAECHSGRYQNVTGQSECFSCEPGFFASNLGTTRCEACAKGMYESEGSRSACLECDTGTFSNSLASTSCENCPPGEFQGSGGESSCLKCPPGTISTNKKSTLCEACPLGKFQKNTGASSCDDCDLGTYSFHQGTSECLECGLGKYIDSLGKEYCTECEAGKFQNETGQSGCSVCNAGKYSNSRAQSSCENCVKGFYSVGGSSLCLECEGGKYQASSGQTECSDCSIGKFSHKFTEYGVTDCTDCPLGRFQNASGQADCWKCALGSFQNVNGASHCAVCEPGRFTELVAQVVCRPCLVGKLQHDSGQTDCLDCDVGQYQSQVGASSCSDCPPGYFSSGTGFSYCLSCDTGRMQNAAGQSGCLDCVAGRFQPLIGASACADCPAGTFTESDGQVNCSQCEGGAVGDGTGCSPCPSGQYPAANLCEPCPAGRFSPGGLSNCSMCSLHDWAVEMGSAACDACPLHSQSDSSRTNCLCEVNYYGIRAVYFDNAFHDENDPWYQILNDMDAEAVEEYFGLTDEERHHIINDISYYCVACPDGADCSEVGTTMDNVLAEELYAVDSTGTYFVPCHPPEACQTQGCALGYTGIFCKECFVNDTERYVPVDLTCVKCLPTEGTYVIMVTCFLLFVFYVYNKLKGRPPRSYGVWFKIFYNSFQVNAIAASFAWKSPLAIKILGLEGDVGFAYANYFTWTCLFPDDWEDGTAYPFQVETVLYAFFPIILAVLSGVGVLLSSGCLGFCSRQKLKQLINLVIGVAGIPFLMMQPFLVEKAAALFRCEPLGHDPDDHFLMSAPSVRCWSGNSGKPLESHWFLLLTVGLPMMLLYAVLLPLAVMLWLRRSYSRIEMIVDTMRPEEGLEPFLSERFFQTSLRLSAPSTRRLEEAVKSLDQSSQFFLTNYGFLFLGYTKECYLWEVNLICRKTLLYLIGVVFVLDLRTQGMLGLLIVSFAMSAHTAYSPFLLPFMNRYETVSLLVSAISFFLGQFTISVELPGISGNTSWEHAGSVLFVIHVLYIAYSLYVLALSIYVEKNFLLNKLCGKSPEPANSPPGASHTGSSSIGENVEVELQEVKLAPAPVTLPVEDNFDGASLPPSMQTGTASSHNKRPSQLKMKFSKIKRSDPSKYGEI